MTRNSAEKQIGNDHQNLLDLKDAVKLIGLSSETLLIDLGLGKIQARWINREWWFERGDLGQY